MIYLLHLFALIAFLLHSTLAQGTVPPLQDFQVQQPPPTPPSKACEVILVDNHSFGNSYYVPALVNYAPPTDCGPVGDWSAVTLNMTTTSAGVQYDRLTILSLNATEIWRSSTAEPTPNGIVFTALKDVTRYSYLFSGSGYMVLELDNLLEPSAGLTGIYNVTLTATFYEPTFGWPKTKKADLILPLSNLELMSNPVLSVPPGANTTVTFPRNMAQAYVEIYASGNAEEEFWYTSIADEYYYDIPAGAAYPYGPFREVRVLIDGVVAGAAFPYPVVFTGGILPTIWRPISSYGSFDQPTYYVDITPFIGTLSDGGSHVFTLDVASAEANHTINGNWYLSGNIQIQLASTTVPTTGKITSYNVSPYALPTTTGVVAPNGDVNVTVSATRYVMIEAEITTDGWLTTQVRWEQSLEYTNFQAYLDDANVEIVNQLSSGTSQSTHNGLTTLYDQFSFPFYLDYYTVYTDESDVDYAFAAVIDHQYNRQFLPDSLIPGFTITTSQNGTGFFYEYSNGTNAGNGTTSEYFNYYDTTGATYTRSVTATNSNITYNSISGSLAGDSPFGRGQSWIPKGMAGAGNAFVGRFPGVARKDGQGVIIW